MTAGTAELRTYGGWRRSRGIGVGGLDTRQTAVFMAAVGCVTVLTAFSGGRGGLIAAVPAAFVVAVTLWRRDGILLLDYAAAAARYRTAKARGETSYRGQVMARWPQSTNLPGVLATTEVLDVEVPGQARCGLVWDRRSGLVSGTLLLSTGGTLLTDSEAASGYVSSWGALLADLADQPAVSWAAITVEITPDGGTALLADHAERLDPAAPPLAQQVMAELSAAAPAAAARVSTRLTVTVDPAHGGHPIASIEDGAAQTLRVLTGIDPAAAGASILRLATATDLIRMVRNAYDPTSRIQPPLEWANLSWGEAGPTGAEEHPNVYDHDGAFSVTYALLEAPRQRVAHSVLLRLLSPGRFPRRVTLLYRVLSREEAGGLLERETVAADARSVYRQRTKRDESARERRDRTLTSAQAEEEALGAGLVQYSLFVTTTAADAADLPMARAEVETAASGSRLKLRVCRFAQSAAFAVGLPCGVYPPYAKSRR